MEFPDQVPFMVNRTLETAYHSKPLPSHSAHISSTFNMQGKLGGFLNKARDTANAAGGQASAIWKVSRAVPVSNEQVIMGRWASAMGGNGEGGH